MFTTNHFIWIALCLVFILGLLYFSVKYKFSFKLATYIMCGISIASELLKIFTHIQTPANHDGGVLLPKSLPFHLCSILIFVFFYLAIGKNEEKKETLKSLFVPIGIVGGIMAIIMATSGVDFAAPYAYQCFVYHAGIVWYAFYLILTKQVKLGLKPYIKDSVLLLCLVFIMIWVNSILRVYDTNFFFLVYPPAENLPILNLNHGWFAYFFSLLACGFILTFLVHLPSIIKECKNKNK